MNNLFRVQLKKQIVTNATCRFTVSSKLQIVRIDNPLNKLSPLLQTALISALNKPLNESYFVKNYDQTKRSLFFGSSAKNLEELWLIFGEKDLIVGSFDFTYTSEMGGILIIHHGMLEKKYRGQRIFQKILATSLTINSKLNRHVGFIIGTSRHPAALTSIHSIAPKLSISQRAYKTAPLLTNTDPS